MSNFQPELRFAIEWENGSGVKGAELRATWSRLSISIGDEMITFVEDRRAKSMRDAVYCSAYPLAEWFTFNWWPLFNEPRKASSGASKHSTRFAGEGQAFPDLQLYSRDGFMDASWRRYSPKESPVLFPNNGSEILSTEQVKQEIGSFIDTVIARLHESGIHHCSLMQEWDAIRSTEDEELDFCAAVGALGLDPYDLDDSQADDVVSVATSIPVELQSEFFQAADPQCFKEQAEWVLAYATMIGNWKGHSPLTGKKGLYHERSNGARPWEVGYELAHKFIEEFYFHNTLTISDEFDHLCWILVAEPQSPLRPGPPSFEAIARLPNDSNPWIATSKKRKDSQTFLQARAICDYLCMQTEQSSLLTRLNSSRQSRNRAFAAELLAPAEEIQKQVSGSRISREEVEDLAYEFKVSSAVIEHQVINHRIAELEKTI